LQQASITSIARQRQNISRTKGSSKNKGEHKYLALILFM
jgi:hypothetical protein